jgi:chromosome partitioning protein
MRRIALINQKGGVGKTTTAVNLGAALAEAGKRVLLVDLDPQANLSLHLDCIVEPDEPSTYSVLLGNNPVSAAKRPTTSPNLEMVPSSIDLSGAELELASAFGREGLLRDALDQWEQEHQEANNGASPVDYVLLDCPPSLGLLSINGMVAAREVLVTLQTEFFALQGMTKLVEVVQLLKKRLNPELEIAGILPCLYDSRLKLAREVLAEIRKYFPSQTFERPIGKNVKLAEAPSYGQTIFEYAPESAGAQDYRSLAQAVIAQEPAPEAEETPEPAVELTPTPPPTPDPEQAASAPPTKAAPKARAKPKAKSKPKSKAPAKPRAPRAKKPAPKDVEVVVPDSAPS